MLKNARLIAARREPVLITGPSGTGKELVARIMLNDQSDDRFFPVNCAGVPDTLFESLLFGHKRGSFTGADQDRNGLLLDAGDGVVFFDEVGELPLTQQAKLLRVLETNRVLPVGGSIELPIRCRFVFATNRPLAKWVENYMRGDLQCAFREDLLYRINALELRTYSLLERPDDVPLLAASIAKSLGGSFNRETETVPYEIVASPGNVRALRNWLLQREVFGIGADDINPATGDNA